MSSSRDRFVLAVQAFIRRHRMFGKQDRILVGVSGGADSMVLVEALLRAGYRVGIAHVNFKLRGAASDQDAAFVAARAKAAGLPFHLLEAPAKTYARAHRLGLQEAAREIRYRYFEAIRQEAGYACVAVAHHRDDALETFFMHLLRGAGLRGLSSIPEKQGSVVRPLLGTSRKEIEAFARRIKLRWREDASNRDEHYERNRIRARLMPVLHTLTPRGTDGILRGLEHLRFARGVFEGAVASLKRKHISTLPDGTRYLALPPLREHPFGGALLHELLRGTGFEPGEPEKVVAASRSGTRFKTDAGYLVVDRDRLLLVPYSTPGPQTQTIGPRTRRIRLPEGVLAISRKGYQAGEPVPASRREHWLDLSRLQFPLQVRGWQAGDRFRPLGMQGSRKLSDYLTDRKFSLLEKEKVRLVLSEGRIVCILGERIAEDVRITDSTRKILRLQWSPTTKP